MFVTKSGNCGEMFLMYLLLVAVLMFSCGNSQQEYRGVNFTRLDGRHSGDKWIALYSGEMYSAKFPHESSSFYLQWYFWTPNGFGGGLKHGDVNFHVLDNSSDCEFQNNDQTNATCAIEGDYVITNFSVSGIEESMDKAILLLRFQNTTQLGNKTISVSVMTRLDGNAEGSVWPVDYAGDMFSANFLHSSVLGSRFYWVLKHSSGTELGRAEVEVDTVADTCSKLSPTSLPTLTNIINVLATYIDCTCELDGSHVTTKLVAKQLIAEASGSVLVLEYPRGEGIANRTIVLSEYRGVNFTRLDGRHSGDEWTALYSGEMYSAKFPHESSSFYLQWYFWTPNGVGGGRTHGDVNFHVLDNSSHCDFQNNDQTNATCAIEGDYVVTNFSVHGIEESMDEAVLLLRFQNGTQLGNKTISVSSVMTRLDGNAEGSMWPGGYVGDMFSANFFHSIDRGSRFYWVLKHSNGTELGHAELEVHTVAAMCKKLFATSGYTDGSCEYDGGHVTTKFVANQLPVAASGSVLVLEYPRGEGIANRTIVLSATATTAAAATTTTTTTTATTTTTTTTTTVVTNSTVGEDGVELQQDSAANFTPPTITILSTFVCFLFIKYLQVF